MHVVLILASYDLLIHLQPRNFTDTRSWLKTSYRYCNVFYTVLSSCFPLLFWPLMATWNFHEINQASYTIKGCVNFWIMFLLICLDLAFRLPLLYDFLEFHCSVAFSSVYFLADGAPVACAVAWTSGSFSSRSALPLEPLPYALDVKNFSQRRNANFRNRGPNFGTPRTDHHGRKPTTTSV